MKKAPRQSKDFHEIINLQSDMEVSQEHWDGIFHNWDSPSECTAGRRGLGCTICEQLSKGMVVGRKSTGDFYDKDGKIEPIELESIE